LAPQMVQDVDSIKSADALKAAIEERVFFDGL
jgi:hypothetical protein